MIERGACSKHAPLSRAWLPKENPVLLRSSSMRTRHTVSWMLLSVGAAIVLSQACSATSQRLVSGSDEGIGGGATTSSLGKGGNGGSRDFVGSGGGNFAC